MDNTRNMVALMKAIELNDRNFLDTAGMNIEDARYRFVGALACHALFRCKAHPEEALDFLKKGIAIATEIGEEINKVKSFDMIANVYEAMSQWNDIIELSRKFIDKVSLLPSKKMEINAYLRLATAFFRTDNYEKAVVYAKKSIETVRDSQDTNAGTVTQSSYSQEGNAGTEMTVLAILGKSYLELNVKLDEAFKCGERYLEIATNARDKQAEMEAHYLLAETYNRTDQFDNGLNHATKGMVIAKELKNDTAMKKFNFLLSSLYTLVMDDKSTSLDPVMKAASEVPISLREELEALVKAVKTGDVNQQVLVQIRLYNCYRSKLKHEQAIHCLEQVIALQPNDSHLKLASYAYIGLSYMEMKKYKEGLQYCEGGLREVSGCYSKKTLFDFYFYISQLYVLNNNMQLADRYLNEAVQCFESLYGSVGSNDHFKLSVNDRYNKCFRLLSLVYVNFNRKEEALLVLDKCRARALKEILVAKYGIQKNKEVRDLTFSDIETLVSNNEFAIFYYSVSGFNSALDFVVGCNYFEASVCKVGFDEGTYNQVINKMFDEIELLQDVNCEDRVLDTEQDIKHQKQEEKQDNEQKRVILLDQLERRRFVVCKKEILMCDNEKCRQANALEFLHFLINPGRQPLLHQSEFVFIPDGSLCKIPFAALQDPDTGKYLSETKRIRVAPSIATLKLLSENAPDYHSNEGALIIGDPHVGEVMLDGKVTVLPKLGKAQIEAKAIANSLCVEPLIGAAATKQAVLEKLQQGVAVVHIAAHGYLEKASIVLAPSPEIRATKIPDEEDYMLTMADVQQAQVRAQLVVLSCCHSGRGKIRSEGVVGMCRAFLASGARAVVASLWAIDDEATLEFMLIFYENLRNGKSASTSLQETMNEMRMNTCSKYKQPKYWAPFFIMGDDVTLSCF